MDIRKSNLSTRVDIKKAGMALRERIRGESETINSTCVIFLLSIELILKFRVRLSQILVRIMAMFKTAGHKKCQLGKWHFLKCYTNREP